MSFDSQQPRPAKRLSRLLPAAATATSSSSDAAGYSAYPHLGPRLLEGRPLAPKRPRVGVPIACDRCRTKKIRCDGERPNCASCERKGISECHYEDPLTKDTKAGYLVEAIQLLNCLAPHQVTSALLSLIDLDRDVEVISALRELAKIAAQPTVDFPGTDTSFARMLEAKHPFTYPVFEPIDPREPSDHLKRLVTPRSRVMYQHENMPSDPGKAHRHDTQATADARQIAPAPGQPLRDVALDGLNISHWTTVPVSDDFAARAISLYLLTDHRLLCPFDRKAFARSLVRPDLHSYCTPSLVNALMYWCCQTYASIDSESIGKAELFRIEAERLLDAETESPTALGLTTEMFLSLGHLVQGRDHASIQHLANASTIAMDLGLFGVPEETGKASLELMTEEQRRIAAYPTWGVFNWTVLMSLFYRQQGVAYPQYPPMMPIPRDHTDDGEETGEDAGFDNETEAKTQKQHEVFPPLCEFWKIMHEVTTVFYRDSNSTTYQSISLQFAEFKYRELLAWADALPVVLARSGQAQDVVIIIHLWLHSAILDIFRPFVYKKSEDQSAQKLRTFSAAVCTPKLAYDASIHQLKQLVITYRSRYTSSNYTIIWQTALLYTANAMLRSNDDDRLEYFLICIYSFQGLRQCFRVTEAIVQALLAMAMQQGVIGGNLARTILADLKQRAPLGEEAGQAAIRAPFIANLDFLSSDTGSGTVEELADQFEESLDFMRYTMLFNQE